MSARAKLVLKELLSRGGKVWSVCLNMRPGQWLDRSHTSRFVPALNNLVNFPKIRELLVIGRVIHSFLSPGEHSRHLSLSIWSFRIGELLRARCSQTNLLAFMHGRHDNWPGTLAGTWFPQTRTEHILNKRNSPPIWLQVNRLNALVLTIVPQWPRHLRLHCPLVLMIMLKTKKERMAGQSQLGRFTSWNEEIDRYGSRTVTTGLSGLNTSHHRLESSVARALHRSWSNRHCL